MTDDINAKLDALTEQVSAISSALGVTEEQVKARHSADPDRLTAADVHAAGFATTRLAMGYSIEQVDSFLDRVAAELERLTEERDAARRERDALR
ncbi:DivIVA domain-containing protein [Actinomadura opuntiae]|uniref:DivIVA domain-containing protein n=1 Tax=Actinomadura sp. OS1-43 TaxID=604315 RepID=UPI00255B28FA|nr:DivIVA domain-containing protein [Actinomadura sp. OS1-43]MDL4812836.1 DivIVA domain-containing protein [Actinomadura sp. OS1-43]